MTCERRLVCGWGFGSRKGCTVIVVGGQGGTSNMSSRITGRCRRWRLRGGMERRQEHERDEKRQEAHHGRTLRDRWFSGVSLRRGGERSLSPSCPRPESEATSSTELTGYSSGVERLFGFLSLQQFR